MARTLALEYRRFQSTSIREGSMNQRGPEEYRGKGVFQSTSIREGSMNMFTLLSIVKIFMFQSTSIREGSMNSFFLNGVNIDGFRPERANL